MPENNNETTEPELARQVLDALTEIVRGTSWAPPEGGIMVDALVVMIHRDADDLYGACWLSAGSAEQAEGMARRVLRSLDQSDIARGTHREMP